MLEGNDMIFPDQVSDSRRVFRLDVNIFTEDYPEEFTQDVNASFAEYAFHEVNVFQYHVHDDHVEDDGDDDAEYATFGFEG